MNANQIEVYEFYKQQHHKAVVLYRLPEGLLVLGDDLNQVSHIFSSINILEPGVGLLPDEQSTLSKLSKNRFQVKLVQYRNDNGEYVLPDIKLIKLEQEMDY